jgi:hypothetical protein
MIGKKYSEACWDDVIKQVDMVACWYDKLL